MIALLTSDGGRDSTGIDYDLDDDDDWGQDPAPNYDDEADVDYSSQHLEHDQNFEIQPDTEIYDD